MYYAGIGSRETPTHVCELMTKIASVFAQQGQVLRSGAAVGADQAFMKGAGTRLECYIPWHGYESTPGMLPTPDAYLIASKYHPAWANLKRGAQALHARNAHIMLGANLDSPVEFALCWTQDGAITKTTSKTGGTGQALRMAIDLKIPIYNLQRPEHYEYCVQYVTGAVAQLGER